MATNSTGGYEIFHNNAGILVASILHPFGRGSVTIKSTDPFEEPTIDPRYGSNPLDIQIIIEGIKFQTKLLATTPLAKLGPLQVLPPPFTDDALLELWVKAGLKTNYHPSGTASMLPKELGGVVDTSLKVYGTANLRVVDGGVFPLLPGSHIGAAVYAVAEKVRIPSHLELTIMLTRL
jgi:choline dehydrogenase